MVPQAESFLRFLVELSERGLIPEPLLRLGIRRLLARRLAQEERHFWEKEERAGSAFVARMRQSPVALATAAANL